MRLSPPRSANKMKNRNEHNRFSPFWRVCVGFSFATESRERERPREEKSSLHCYLCGAARIFRFNAIIAMILYWILICDWLECFFGKLFCRRTSQLRGVEWISALAVRSASWTVLMETKRRTLILFRENKIKLMTVSTPCGLKCEIRNSRG